MVYRSHQGAFLYLKGRRDYSGEEGRVAIFDACKSGLWCQWHLEKAMMPWRPRRTAKNGCVWKGSGIWFSRINNNKKKEIRSNAIFFFLFPLFTRSTRLCSDNTWTHETEIICSEAVANVVQWESPFKHVQLCLWSIFLMSGENLIWMELSCNAN